MKTFAPTITSISLSGANHPGLSQVVLTLKSEANTLPVEISATVMLRDAMTLTVQELQTQVLAAIVLAATPHEVRRMK